jgi:hypothetical protein
MLLAAPRQHEVPNQLGSFTQFDAQKESFAFVLDGTARPRTVTQFCPYGFGVHHRRRKEAVNI